MNKIDLAGKTFGYFTVVGEAEPHIRNSGHKVRMWDCVCTCGEHRTLNTQEIKTEKRRSCGCKQREFRKILATTHGDSHTRLHNTWSKIKERCYTATDYHYKWYGGRGIKMCGEWKENYVAFRDWALSHGYSDDLTIDRIDNDGDYCPENCRWVTMKVQANNSRRNVYYEAFGDRHTLAEWADLKSVSRDFLKGRISRGWSLEKALTEKKRETINGHYVYDENHVFVNRKAVSV